LNGCYQYTTSIRVSNWYQNCNTIQSLIIGEYVEVEESLYTYQVVIWVNGVLNHIDARVVLPRYEGYEWHIDLNGYHKPKYS
jgi:hypothetical protein